MQWPDKHPPALGDHPFVVAVATLSGLLAIVALTQQLLGFDGLSLPLLGSESSLTASVDHDVDATAATGVRIDRPRPGEGVEQYVEVRYSVVGDTQARDARRLLIVIDPLGQAWNWGPIAEGESRRIQLGQPGDRNKPFEVGVVATSEVVPVGVPNQQRPRGPFTSVTVQRK